MNGLYHWYKSLVVANRRGLLLVVIGWILVQAWFLPTAFRIDETNIIAIAKQIAREPLDPYGFEINWLGQTEPAFAILSNPPGVPAWLAVFGRLFGWNETVLHLSVLPFSVLGLICTALLAGRFGAPPVLTAASMVCSPAFFLGSQVVMPDVPMLALLVASIAAAAAYRDAGRRSAAVGAFLFGMAAPLLKYNGIILFPILLLLAFAAPARRARLCLIAASPLVGLGLWSLSSLLIYGKNHFLESARFQATPEFDNDVVTGALAVLGLGVLPLVAAFGGPHHTRLLKWRPIVAAAGGVIFFLVGTSMLDYRPASAILFAVSGALAVAFLYRISADAIPALQGDSTALILVGWVILVLASQFRLGFTSVRYLLPLLPAALLLVLSSPLALRPRILVSVMMANFILTLAVAVGDARIADVPRALIHDRVVPLKSRLQGRLFFSGHWGFQYYAEQAEGRSLEAGVAPDFKPGDLVVIALNAFPPVTEPPIPAGLHAESESIQIDSGWPVHTIDCLAAANFYGNAVGTCQYSGRAFLPFAFSTDPSERYEIITVVARGQ